ncbi:hypothetical protein [Legionella pneumophila]|uniref:hypothetical protein n=1 Tax=Legionella pneumophila TaxID=446 RepID=UPI0005C433B0|nr:hypothetical protein [Legionella pneumophila]GAN31425.1 hypothetical protein lpymt_03045 [Legionella pneumophila]
MISYEQLMTLLMLQRRNDNVFFKMPKPIILQKIGDITPEQALMCVIDADYEKIEAIFQINPSLMFVGSKVKDINGKSIETTPLQYSIYALDSYTWKICQSICLKNKNTHPEFLTWFNEHHIEDTINLEPLFEAYRNYVDKWEKTATDFDINQDQTNFDQDLLDAWFNVGLKQRDYLPRHLLREMCQLSGRQEEYDLVLLTLAVEQNVDLMQLKKISETHQKNPILIKQGKQVSLYGHSSASYKSQITHLPADIFQTLEFPKENNKTRLIKADVMTNAMWHVIHDRKNVLKENCNQAHSEPWDIKSLFNADTFPHPQNMIIGKVTENGGLEKFSFDAPGWGTEFALARGSASVCLAIFNPLGMNGLLGYRVQNDIEILSHLIQIRALEREKQFAIPKARTFCTLN